MMDILFWVMVGWIVIGLIIAVISLALDPDMEDYNIWGLVVVWPFWLIVVILLGLHLGFCLGLRFLAGLIRILFGLDDKEDTDVYR